MILFLTDPDRDYAADYLAHGLALLFPGKVNEWPRKPSLHWKQAPSMDCDVDIDTITVSQDETEQTLRDRKYELIVVPTLRGRVAQRLFWWRELLQFNRDRIVYVDGEDHHVDTRPLFFTTAGVDPVAYFKRELPLGELWATPLPFGYPEERIVEPGGDRDGAFYAVHLWDWAKGGIREQLAHALKGYAEVHLSTTDAERLSVLQHRDRLRKSCVAVSPSGRGFGTNRHLEIIAAGCAPVIERPWRQWPNAPLPGVEAMYFGGADEAADHVRNLLHNSDYALALAKAAQQNLRQYHTTRVRAQTVWDAVHGK